MGGSRTVKEERFESRGMKSGRNCCRILQVGTSKCSLIIGQEAPFRNLVRLTCSILTAVLLSRADANTPWQTPAPAKKREREREREGERPVSLTFPEQLLRVQASFGRAFLRRNAPSEADSTSRMGGRRAQKSIGGERTSFHIELL